MEAADITLDWKETAKLIKVFTMTAFWSNHVMQLLKLPFNNLENDQTAEKHGWKTA